MCVVFVCVCVPIYGVPIYERVEMCNKTHTWIQAININKYRRNSYDVIRNMKVEIAIYVLGDVKQTVKWNIFGQKNTIRIRKISQVCPSSRLWEGLELWFRVTILILLSPSGRWPQLWRLVSVCSSLHLLTRAHCAKCSPSIPLCLAS